MSNDPRRHYESPLRQTPFHARTAPFNTLNHWGAWAGYTTALSYDDVTMEYTAIRNAASVYDISPMIKYRISGVGAGAYLNRLALRSATKLPVGAVHYTAWCDDMGKVLDDGTLFRLGEHEYRLCCQERHLPWLLDSAEGMSVAIADVTDHVAALSLQGPCSFSVLRAAGLGAVETLKPFRVMTIGADGIDVLISRTGFTGDLGYELWTAPEHALGLWDRLFSAGAPWGIRPVGSQALDIARIEAGFIVTNFDFIPADQAVREDRARTPHELGLAWMIDWDKGHFNGRRALLAEKNNDSARWALVGLDIEGNVSAEHSLVYDHKNREIGHITAAVWSPATKRNIAIAHLRRPSDTERADKLMVEVYAQRELQYVKLMLKATICDRPFFSPARRRATPPNAH